MLGRDPAVQAPAPVYTDDSVVWPSLSFLVFRYLPGALGRRDLERDRLADTDSP